MKQLAKAAGLLHVCAGLFVLGILTGCSSGPVQGDPSWRLVPVTDVASVVGEWEGVVKKERNVLPGSVHLMIRENGTYLFTGQHAGTVAVGSGFLESRDGRLIGNTDRRAVTLSLYDHKGKAVLHVDSTNHETGERFHGEFTKIE